MVFQEVSEVFRDIRGFKGYFRKFQGNLKAFRDVSEYFKIERHSRSVPGYFKGDSGICKEFSDAFQERFSECQRDSR